MSSILTVNMLHQLVSCCPTGNVPRGRRTQQQASARTHREQANVSHDARCMHPTQPSAGACQHGPPTDHQPALLGMLHPGRNHPHCCASGPPHRGASLPPPPCPSAFGRALQFTTRLDPSKPYSVHPRCISPVVASGNSTLWITHTAAAAVWRSPSKVRSLIWLAAAAISCAVSFKVCAHHRT
jgi:hypothetical protein